jgi:hypothetical protein
VAAVSSEKLINCDSHGPQQETFVCAHILDGSRAEKRAGFFYVPDPDNPRPDAWCAECNDRFQRGGGDWEILPESEQPKIAILCGACYDEAKSFHMSDGT